jgi:hypothetical protein
VAWGESRSDEYGPVGHDGEGDAGAAEERLHAEEVGGEGAGEEVAEGEHGVRLATAEVGLKLHHGVAARAREAPEGVAKETPEAFGKEGAAEELARVAVFALAFAPVDLGEVRGELGLLVAVGVDVLVGVITSRQGEVRPAVGRSPSRPCSPQCGLAQ